MLNINQNLKNILSSLCLAVVLFGAIGLAMNSGRVSAEAEAVLKEAESLTEGLEYFYKDQNRFPSATEFADREIMLNYFSSFPAREFPSKVCSQSFVYKRITASAYQLSFCLPKDVANFKKGWNTVSSADL